MISSMKKDPITGIVSSSRIYNKITYIYLFLDIWYEKGWVAKL